MQDRGERGEGCFDWAGKQGAGEWGERGKAAAARAGGWPSRSARGTTEAHSPKISAFAGTDVSARRGDDAEGAVRTIVSPLQPAVQCTAVAVGCDTVRPRPVGARAGGVDALLVGAGKARVRPAAHC
jgi:hypothetical protein